MPQKQMEDSHTLTDRVADQNQSERFSIDPFELVLYIVQRKRRILSWTLTAMALTAVATLLVSNTYQSTAVILPPRQDQSASALLSGQLGALSSLGGGGLGSVGLNLKNPNEAYSGLLQSRTIALRLVDKFDLKKRFHEKTTEDAIKALAKHTSIELSKDNLIRVTVTSKDRDFSSELANAYVDGLHDLNTHLALTDSSQRRFFFQQQLDQEKVLLANAESTMRDTQKRTGVVQPSGQAEMVSRNISTLRTQITARQAELQSMETFYTDQNPDSIRLNAQIASLQHQLAQLESSEKPFTPGDIEVPTSKLPESSLEYARNLREVRLHEGVYELLVRQFEAAKIDEAKTAPMIQVVDRAVPAERKSGPPRTIITLGVGMAVFTLLIFWSVLSYGFHLAGLDEATASKMRHIRSSLVGRK